jgi:hypothetical protein
MTMGCGWGKLTVEEGKNGSCPAQSSDGRWPRVHKFDEMGSGVKVITGEVPFERTTGNARKGIEGGCGSAAPLDRVEREQGEGVPAWCTTQRGESKGAGW